MNAESCDEQAVRRYLLRFVLLLVAVKPTVSWCRATHRCISGLPRWRTVHGHCSTGAVNNMNSRQHVSANRAISQLYVEQRVHLYMLLVHRTNQGIVALLVSL